MSTTSAKYPQKILIISDEHRGAEISNFEAYQRNILERIGQYQHVVFLGDNTELFYPKDNAANDYASLLDTLSGKGQKHWRDKIQPEGKRARKMHEAYHSVKSAIRGETSFMQTLLDTFPEVHFHKVLGNHENVRRYRNKMKEIQEKHAGRFEWSPEAIRIGDTLFTHGHLQLHGTVQNDQINDKHLGSYRMRDAKKDKKWRNILKWVEKPGYLAIQYYHNSGSAAAAMHRRLLNGGDNQMTHYIENGIEHPFSMEGVQHVFFGHTHVKFDNKKIDGISYHNTGAMVHVTSGNPENLGILEAELSAGGQISNVQPVYIGRDKHIITPKPSPWGVGR